MSTGQFKCTSKCESIINEDNAAPLVEAAGLVDGSDVDTTPLCSGGNNITIYYNSNCTKNHLYTSNLKHKFRSSIVKYYVSHELPHAQFCTIMNTM